MRVFLTKTPHFSWRIIHSSYTIAFSTDKYTLLIHYDCFIICKIKHISSILISSEYAFSITANVCFILSISTVYSCNIFNITDETEISNRKNKFKNELKNHFNINNICAYFALTDFFAAVDQRAKNQMMTS